MTNLTPVHSPLGGSAAERFIACRGSAALIHRLGRRTATLEPDWTRHGIAAHEVVAHCLQQSLDVWEVMDRDWNGITFADDETKSMQDYLNFVRLRVRELEAQYGEAYLHIEYSLAHPEIHPLFYGKLDAGITAGSYAEIIDYKHGEGVAVDADKNPQLRYYAAGFVYDKHEITGVGMWIVQPRAFHQGGPTRFFTESVAALMQWVDYTLVPAMIEAANGSTELTPGEHCRFCPAKLHCPAIKQELVVVSDVQRPPQDATNEELGALLERIPRARMLITALETEALRRMQDGIEIPGMKLVTKRTVRKWKAEAEEALKARYGDAAYETKLKSPAVVEDMRGGAALTKEWAYSPDAGFTIAPVSDKRLAYPVKNFADDFPVLPTS